MNFEDLQNSWQRQPVKDPGDIDQLKLAMETNWNKHQRRVLRTNIFLTLCFILTGIGITCVYFAYHAQFGWAFRLSIFFIILLMIVYVGVSWKSYGLKKETLENPSTDYISYQLKKLHWQRKTITTFSQIYAFLLWINIMCYTWEVTARGSLTFRFTAMLVITVYIVGINLWQRLTKQKKALKKVDHMIADLSHLKKELAV